jgi:hypothetical protein
VQVKEKAPALLALFLLLTPHLSDVRNTIKLFNAKN